MTMNALLDAYYDGLSRRSGWDAPLADDFVFVGANANAGSRGRAAYGKVLEQFFRMFETVDVKQSMIDGDTACVVATYHAVSPSGKKTTFDVAEVWTARGGKLASLAIYFDTAGWRSFNAA